MAELFKSSPYAGPTIVWAEINNVDTTKVNILFSQYLSPMTLAAASSGFSLTGKTISSFIISGALVILTVTVAYAYADSVVLNYTPPSIDALRNDVGESVAAVTSYSVTNNIGNTSDIAVTFVERTATFEDVSSGIYRAQSGAASLVSYALADRRIPPGTTGWIQMDYASTTNQSSTLGFRSTYTNDPYNLVDFSGITSTGTPNALLRANSSSTFSSAGYTMVVGTDTKWRLRRDAVARTVTIDTYAASAWTIRYTFPTSVYYHGELFLVAGINVALKQLLNPIAVGTLAV